jgi:hypothetical protein
MICLAEHYNVWIGYELGTENYKHAIPIIIIIIMELEFISIKYWFEAQTEEINNIEKNLQIQNRIYIAEKIKH